MPTDSAYEVSEGKRDIISIEYLRAFSMLYIVGYWHLFNYTDAFPEYSNGFTNSLTHVVLGLFVIISGFLVGSSTNRSAGLFHFFKKRLIRIYPLYAIAILIFYVYGINDAKTSITSLFLVSMYYGPSPWTLWFITMLALFYLATPLLLKLVERPVDYFLFSGGLYLLTLVLLTTFKTVDERVLLYFPCYVLGIYCSQYGIRTSVVNVTSALLMMGGWALLELIVTNSWMFSLFRNTLMVVSFSYLILVISYLNEKNFKRLTIVSLLSYSSFTMYLFHRPVYIDLTALYFPENEQLQVLYLSTVCLVAVVCVSWAVQKAYDMGYAAISKRGSS